MHTLTVDRMTVDARLPRADNALIDRLQAALQRWSDHSRLSAPDHLVARILPALTLDLGRIPEETLRDELGTRLDRALADALARLLPVDDPARQRADLARWLQHGTPLWTHPGLCPSALGALLYAELRRPGGVAWLTPLLVRQAARARLLRLPPPLVEAILHWLEDAIPPQPVPGTAADAHDGTAGAATPSPDAPGVDSAPGTTAPPTHDKATDPHAADPAAATLTTPAPHPAPAATTPEPHPAPATASGHAPSDDADRLTHQTSVAAPGGTPSPAQRLARVLDACDDAPPRSGRERGHWRRLLALVAQGLEQDDADDDWLQQLDAALAGGGTPPGLALLLPRLLAGSRLPYRPGSARARAALQALRDGLARPAPQHLLARLRQMLADWPEMAPLAALLGPEGAAAALPPASADAALQLWLADAVRLMAIAEQGWPQRSGDALYRLRQALRERGPAALPPLIQALRRRLEHAGHGDERALCDLQRLPRFLASPALPARLADHIEHFLHSPAPSLPWRRKLTRQLRQWAEGKQAPGALQWEDDARQALAAWRSALQGLPPSPLCDAALAASAPRADADRRALAAALYALEKLLPTLLAAHPRLSASPHWQSQLKRRRLRLWRGSVAAWQPLADSLAAQCAHPDGIAGLWPDALTLAPAELESRLAAQPDPALRRLWQASRAAHRPLRGEERRQWQQLAGRLQDLLDGQRIDEDSRFWADDAGLVLLWPFLPELFRRCGWLDQAQRWRDEAGQRKAWRALAGLIGRDEDHEQGHSARVLLGLEIDEPLDEAPQLDEAERAHLADAVAAIEQAWAAALPAMPLAGGIATLFLRRRGIWRISQAGWQLTVEGAAQDVLLGRLPWSLGVVMLPWLDGLLTLDWPRPAIPAAADAEGGGDA